MLALVVATVLGVGAVYWLQVHPREDVEAGRTTLLSDCDGEISDWLLSLSEGEPAFFEQAQADIATQAPAAVRVHVYYGAEERRRSFERAVRRAGGRDPQYLIWHKTPPHVWPWTRDMFLAAARPDGGPVTLLHHPDHYRIAWRAVIWKAEEMGSFAAGVVGATSQPSGIRIEGGAVVADAERAFVTEDYLQAMLLRRDAADLPALLRQLESVWNRSVAAVRISSAYTSRHCDLHMIPAGKKRIVLASPVLGADLLASIGVKERTTFAASFRDLARQAQPRSPLRTAAEEDYVASFIAFGQSQDTRRSTADLRKQLEALGYTVYEVPLLAAQPATNPEQVVLSYANAVIDERAGRRTVYLPTFRLPTLDRRAAETWRGLGYRVKAIDCLAPAMRGGSVRCLSQVFRGPHRAIVRSAAKRVARAAVGRQH